VAARQDGIKPKRAALAVTAAVESYATRMGRYAETPELDIWYDGMHVDKLIDYFEPADQGRVSVYIERRRSAGPAATPSRSSRPWPTEGRASPRTPRSA